MTDQYYPSKVFAEKFNTYFGEQAAWFHPPKSLTDLRSQEAVLAHWHHEKNYANNISLAVEKFKAASTLDHQINVYFRKLQEAVLTYKTFIANLEHGEYDFSAVTAWPYRGAESLIEKYRNP